MSGGSAVRAADGVRGITRLAGSNAYERRGTPRRRPRSGLQSLERRWGRRPPLSERRAQRAQGRRPPAPLEGMRRQCRLTCSACARGSLPHGGDAARLRAKPRAWSSAEGAGEDAPGIMSFQHSEPLHHSRLKHVSTTGLSASQNGECASVCPSPRKRKLPCPLPSLRCRPGDTPRFFRVHAVHPAAGAFTRLAIKPVAKPNGRNL